MSRLTPDEAAILVLATRLGRSSRPAYSPVAWSKLATRLHDAGKTLADLLEDPEKAISADQDEARIFELLRETPTVLAEAEAFRERGIWSLTLASGTYPHNVAERLGPSAPPVLFGAGDSSLLDRGAIGIVGSRNVSPEGARVARMLARSSADLRLNVVSGAARGVDQEAMAAAYRHGCPVVGVLADSLTRRVAVSDAREAVDDGRVCFVTQQHPDAGFTAGAAMSRNKLIYALSTVTVVVASDEGSGGTWAGATEALDRRYGQVAVWRGDGEGPGNRALEARGAVPISSPIDLDQLVNRPAEAPREQLTFDSL